MNLLERELQKALLGDVDLEQTETCPKPQTPAQHWARVVMMERAAYLKEMARFGSGEASETVREFPGHCAQLLFRSRSGEAEVHERHADLFVVLAGNATLVTGGSLCGAKNTAPGETRGEAIEGGVEQKLGPGDVAHVPAGVAHQLKLAGEQTISCFVMKVEEPEAENPKATR
jgi:mannose-6-phosphate isomerase-like protein (cupin superfamily)